MGESMNTIKLYNGLDIPCIGFGTDRTFIYLRKNIFAGATEFLKDITVGHGYHWKRDTSIINIVKQAPSIGCHLFDTSSAWLTNNVTVLKGVTIGKDSLISAMTLIRKDIPEKSLVAGIPGKVLKDNACWSREYIHDYEKQFWE